MNSIESLRAALLAFRDERDWQRFHTLRNLIVSLNLEAAELLELTQWRDDDEVMAMANDAVGREAFADECADVLLYLILVADAAGVDLLEAAGAKLAKNAGKYPVDKARGTAAKYDKL